MKPLEVNKHTERPSRRSRGRTTARRTTARGRARDDRPTLGDVQLQKALRVVVVARLVGVELAQVRAVLHELAGVERGLGRAGERPELLMAAAALDPGPR